jgi:hypothetical protein
MNERGSDVRVFEYTVRGAGWATATFRFDEADAIIVHVSYLHDSPRDLARALLALDRCGDEIGVAFVEEPGTVLLIMQRDDDRIRLELRRFDTWVTQWPADDDFEPLGSRTMRWRTFRGAVVSALQRVWSEHGALDYETKWHHAFPVEELRALER